MVRRDLIRNVVLVLIFVLAVIFVRIFFFSTYKVTQPFSSHYLKSGDLVTIARKRQPILKDYVVYTVDGKEYLGRIVAEGGQEVTSMDDILYVNHKVNRENYLKADKEKFYSTNSPDQYFTEDFSIDSINGKENTNKIPEGSYLILNDNRQAGKDSRSFGLIKKSQIKGVVSVRIWPFEKIGYVATE